MSIFSTMIKFYISEFYISENITIRNSFMLSYLEQILLQLNSSKEMYNILIQEIVKYITYAHQDCEDDVINENWHYLGIGIRREYMPILQLLVLRI